MVPIVGKKQYLLSRAWWWGGSIWNISDVKGYILSMQWRSYKKIWHLLDIYRTHSYFLWLIIETKKWFKKWNFLPVGGGIIVVDSIITVVVTLFWRRNLAGDGVCWLHRSESQQSPSRFARFSSDLLPIIREEPPVLAPNNCVQTYG